MIKMSENTFSIYVDFKPSSGYSGYDPIVTQKGIFLFKERNKNIPTSWLEIDCKGFKVQLLSGHEYPEFETWEKEISFLISYFQALPKKFVKYLPSRFRSTFNFMFGRFSKEMKEDLSDDRLTTYDGWYYLQIEEKFSELLCVPKFKEKSENKFIYQIERYDWPETFIFLESLTPENMSRSFRNLIGMRKAAAELEVRRQETLKKYSRLKPWRYLE